MDEIKINLTRLDFENSYETEILMQINHDYSMESFNYVDPVKLLKNYLMENYQ